MTSQTSILIGNRAELYPNEPLPDLDSVGGPAYGARIKNDSATGLMAILCNKGLPTRLDLITSLRSIDHPGILRLIDHGVLTWPSDNIRYMVYAFQRPLSPKLVQSIDQPFPQLGEDALFHYFITPMINSMVELERAGVVHNAIRPTNIFWRSGGASPPQLGECVSVPAGVGQPALFEPLERAMSIELGRGPGTHLDDCYAFGVTLALIVLGSNPLKGLSENEVIQAKIDRGSFGSLIGNRRISPTHIEILRGLLADDARQRWNANDLDQWLSGRRLTPKNTDAGKRASRSLEFNGKEYWQSRPLMKSLPDNVPEAVKIIENGSLNKWLRRSLGEEEHASNLEESLRTLKEGGKLANYEDQVVCRTCLAVDPASPLRYRGLSLMPAGIASMMVDAVMNGKNTQILSEIISSQLVTLWIEMQTEGKAELVTLGQLYERMRNLIDKSSFGNGIERVTYELNPGLYCLSPHLRNHYITAPKAVLFALEQVASSANRPNDPIDRHLAAFLIVRDRRSEVLFQAISSSDNTSQRGLAMLTIFSEMQYRYGPDQLPALAQWLLPSLEPTVNRFLSKSFKEKLRLQIKETAKKGDLGALLSLVDDPKRIEYDQQEFMAARMLYLTILKEVTALEYRLNNRAIIVQNLGKPMAASISCFLAIVFILLTMLRSLWQTLFLH